MLTLATIKQSWSKRGGDRVTAWKNKHGDYVCWLLVAAMKEVCPCCQQMQFIGSKGSENVESLGYGTVEVLKFYVLHKPWVCEIKGWFHVFVLDWGEIKKKIR